MAAHGSSIIVGLGELRTSTLPDDVLVCVGLGSCVALCAYDAEVQVAGMAHMVLPASSEGRRVGLESKFVDLAIPQLLDEMERLGALRSRLRLKLTGGARMINGPADDDRQRIGERNVDAANAVLCALGLRVHGDDTGGNRGRTARLYVASGKVRISLIGGDSFEL
ncbi:MAG: chemotaxis protein CheD [Dehalococcoidia bacterium]